MILYEGVIAPALLWAAETEVNVLKIMFEKFGDTNGLRDNEKGRAGIERELACRVGQRVLLYKDGFDTWRESMSTLWLEGCW